MAFYFALFNVSNANNELKNSQPKKGKHQRGNSRRHSVSSTHDLAVDYKPLHNIKPKTGISTSLLFGLPTPANRRKSNPEAPVDTLAVDNSKKDPKKVTFTPSGKPILDLTAGGMRRNRSHCEALSQSMYPESESSRAQRAAEWIYSISLSPDASRERDQDLGSMDNGCRSREMSPVKKDSIPESISKYIDKRPEDLTPTVEQPPPSIDEQIVSCKERIIPIVICPPANHGLIPGAGAVTKGVAVSTCRPPSRLPSILRRKSTSDRTPSLSKATVFRRKVPYQQLENDGTDGLRRDSAASEGAVKPSRLPRLSQTPRSRCTNKQDTIPLIQLNKARDKLMIRSHVY